MTDPISTMRVFNALVYLSKDVHDAIDALISDVERMRDLAMCDCGDHFTHHDKGSCGNCVAATTAGYSVKIIGLEEEIERLRGLLMDCQSITQEHGGCDLFDACDNDGELYQSQALADALRTEVCGRVKK